MSLTGAWELGLSSQTTTTLWVKHRRLTYENSYVARLNYVPQNPVRHGLVRIANQYPWYSAAWFERTARAAQVETIYAFKIDQLRVYDEFEPEPDW